jgi:Zn finger protein HypA/HybF involved in hydrogenase expression
MADTEEEVRLLKELHRREEEIRRLEKQIRGYKGLAEREKGKVASEQPPETKTEPPKTAETASPPHYVGSWQHYCPTCGGENENFKDETECVDCGMHLGAAADLKDLKACPNCGGHKAKLTPKTLEERDRDIDARYATGSEMKSGERPTEVKS